MTRQQRARRERTIYEKAFEYGSRAADKQQDLRKPTKTCGRCLVSKLAVWLAGYEAGGTNGYLAGYRAARRNPRG